MVDYSKPPQRPPPPTPTRRKKSLLNLNTLLILVTFAVFAQATIYLINSRWKLFSTSNEDITSIKNMIDEEMQAIESLLQKPVEIIVSEPLKEEGGETNIETVAKKEYSQRYKYITADFDSSVDSFLRVLALAQSLVDVDSACKLIITVMKDIPPVHLVVYKILPNVEVFSFGEHPPLPCATVTVETKDECSDPRKIFMMSPNRAPPGEKFVWIDPNMLVLQNIDELFGLDHLSSPAVWDNIECKSKTEDMSMSIFVYKFFGGIVESALVSCRDRGAGNKITCRDLMVESAFRNTIPIAHIYHVVPGDCVHCPRFRMTSSKAVQFTYDSADPVEIVRQLGIDWRTQYSFSVINRDFRMDPCEVDFYSYFTVALKRAFELYKLEIPKEKGALVMEFFGPDPEAVMKAAEQEEVDRKAAAAESLKQEQEEMRRIVEEEAKLLQKKEEAEKRAEEEDIRRAEEEAARRAESFHSGNTSVSEKKCWANQCPEFIYSKSAKESIAMYRQMCTARIPNPYNISKPTPIPLDYSREKNLYFIELNATELEMTMVLNQAKGEELVADLHLGKPVGFSVSEHLTESFSEAFEHILALIRCRTPFVYVSYGDGHIDMLEGQTNDTVMGQRLTETLANLDANFFQGLPLPTCSDGMADANIGGGGDLYALKRIFALNKTDGSGPLLTQSPEYVSFSSLFGGRNYPNLQSFLFHFLLARNDIILICSDNVLQNRPVWAHSIFTFPPNGTTEWLKENEGVVFQNAEMIARSFSGYTFLFSAGQISAVLIHAMHAASPANQYIDMGLSLDSILFPNSTASGNENYYQDIGGVCHESRYLLDHDMPLASRFEAVVP